MAQYTIRQGDAKIVSLNITKNGAPVDMTTALGVIAVAIVNGVETTRKYKQAPLGSYGILTIPGVPNNQIDIEVTREHSRQFSVGQLSFCVVARFPDVQFSSGDYEESFTVPAGYIEAGCGLYENP